MELIQKFGISLWEVSLEMAPWLLLGLVAAGLIKALVPQKMVSRWLGGKGVGPVIRSAIVGAPLPLCSCSVIPAAIGLRRQGASKGATTAFLISTPETGVDSVAVSYAMLGPFLTIMRPIAAVASAIGVGIAVSFMPEEERAKVAAKSGGTASTGSCCGGEAKAAAKPVASCCESEAKAAEPAAASCCESENAEAPKPVRAKSCCGGEGKGAAAPKTVSLMVSGQGGTEPIALTQSASAKAVSSCCESEAAASPAAEASCCANESASDNETQPLAKRVGSGVWYAMTRLLDDLLLWLTIGLLLAAAVHAFVPESALEEWGSGPLAMGVMLLVGIPMYICATASTPLAGALLLAGVSPGTVLVFLLAGPATNAGTLGVIRNELGGKTAVVYLIGLAVMSVAFGLLTDWLVGAMSVDVVGQAAHHHGMVPQWLSIGCLVVLALFAIRPLRKLIGRSTPQAATPVTQPV